VPLPGWMAALFHFQEKSNAGFRQVKI
jgi:hypothetical protein